MGRRVLVGYATGRGSTVGVAEAIGKALATSGYTVDVKPLRDRPSLAGYDAMVLGSAVNGGQWLPEALSFLDANAGTLGEVPVAVFCVHGMNAGGGEKQTRRRLAYLDRVRATVTPVAEGFFLGKIDGMGAIANWAFEAFGGAGIGDLRDWEAIRAWGETVRLDA